jgi:hypothetical protein
LPKVLQDWADYQTEMRLLSTLPGLVSKIQDNALIGIDARNPGMH